jgi:hypothetical protein
LPPQAVLYTRRGPLLRPRAPRAGAATSAAENPTAARLISEADKLGVKGINEALTGLAKLFGAGTGKLNSFPAGFDSDTYESVFSLNTTQAMTAVSTPSRFSSSAAEAPGQFRSSCLTAFGMLGKQ